MYEFTSKVRYSEIGPDARMTLRGIVTRMQDAAVFHSDMIGQGPAVWEKHQKIWMIISWQILVHERPLFGTNVTTRTWTYAFRGFNGFRNFVMEDESGKRLAEANTQWVYFDAREQRPARIPKEQSDKSRAIVLATVKGDIHDIGKNIVKVLMESYGFTVYDLGRDVAPESVRDCALEHGCRLVGLSALMTTTVPSMAETIRLLKETDPSITVIVGGAVLTQEYADMIGADHYGADAMDSVRYAEKFYSI